MVHWLFHAERAGVIGSLAALWPAFVGQLLVFRFTARRKWNGMKLGLVLLGLCAMVIESVRAPDMQGGFGIYSALTQRLLYGQLGCFFLYCLVLVLLATARSLYLQMHRRLPRAFEISMWTIVGGNHIVSFVIIERSLKAWAGDDNGGVRDVEGLMRWWNANLLLFQVVALLLLIVYWILFLSLRKRVAKFLHSLEQQETKKKEAAATAAAAAAAAEAASAAAQTNAVATANATVAASTPALQPAHTAVHMSVLALPPSAATASAVGNPDAAAAAPIAGDTTPRASVSVRMAPSQAPASAAPQHLEVNPKRSSNSASNAAPTASSKVTLVRIAQVAPAPSSATPVAAAAAVSQSDTRLSDLRAALRKLNLLTLLVTFLLMGTAVVQLPNQLKYLSHGTIIREVVTSPSDDGADDFPLLSGGSTGMNHLALMTILWYAWSSPRVWASAAYRRQIGIAFWSTLRHGLDESKINQAAYGVGGAAAAHAGARVVSEKRADSNSGAPGAAQPKLSGNKVAAAGTAQPTPRGPESQQQQQPASPPTVAAVAPAPTVKAAW